MGGIKAKFTFSGKYDDYNHIIRQYTLRDILEKVSAESICLFKLGKKSELKGARRVFFKTYTQKSFLPQEHELLIMAWGLVDLAYNAILFTNDYRGKSIQKDEEFYSLVCETSAFNQSNEKDLLEKLDENDFLIYFRGFSGEQFKIESPGAAFDNLGRDLYILFESSKTSKRKINSEQVVMDEIGVDWKKVVTSLLYAWFGSTKFTYMKDFENQFDWKNSGITLDDFHKVMSYYSASYQEIKASPLQRQVLYTKPYIRNSRNQIMSISPHLNLFLYEHSIFWLIRNYYFKKGSQYFTSVFGDYFEEYFRELLRTYLRDGEYSRIPEEDSPRADWKLDICGYKFIIEQKSTLMILSGKQQRSDINAFKTFAERELFKALKQLKETEDAFGDGKYIKIILLYEDYLKSEALNQVFKLKGCDVANDDYFWLVKIDDMERLLQLCESQREQFIHVIEEKIKRNVEHSKEGKSLEQILDELKVPRGIYVQSKKFAYYRNYAQKTIIKYLK